VVLVHGSLILYPPGLRSLFDITMYLDVDADTRLARRVVQASEQSTVSLETVLSRYIRTAKPAYEQFVRPTKANADVIVPRGTDNSVALGLIVQYICDTLEELNAAGGGEKLAFSPSSQYITSSMKTLQESDSTLLFGIENGVESGFTEIPK